MKIRRLSGEWWKQKKGEPPRKAHPWRTVTSWPGWQLSDKTPFTKLVFIWFDSQVLKWGKPHLTGHLSKTTKDNCLTLQLPEMAIPLGANMKLTNAHRRLWKAPIYSYGSRRLYTCARLCAWQERSEEIPVFHLRLTFRLWTRRKWRLGWVVYSWSIEAVLPTYAQKPSAVCGRFICSRHLKKKICPIINWPLSYLGRDFSDCTWQGRQTSQN